MIQKTTKLTATFALLWLVTGPAAAHVRYVVDTDAHPTNPIQFIITVITNPINTLLLALSILAISSSLIIYHRYHPLDTDIHTLRQTLTEYELFLPWILRLSIGLPLLGAGFAGYYFTPALQIEARLFQVFIGFLLLLGLASRAAATLGLIGYLAGLAVYPSLLLASEFIAGFLGIILLGSGRPSADHLLQNIGAAPDTTYGRFDPIHRPATYFNTKIAPYEQYAVVYIRAFTGFNFAYLGLWEKLAHPTRSLAVVDQYQLTAIVPVDPGLWVLGAGLVELTIGLAFILGIYTRSVAAIAFLTLTLTLFGLSNDPVLAHVSLFGLSSALFITGSGPLSIDTYRRAA